VAVGRSAKAKRSRRQRWRDGFETRGVAPSYGGGVLLGLGSFFFFAATNTLAGWLYVMSGLVIALLGLSAWLTRRNLRGLDLERSPIADVVAGDCLQVELCLRNRGNRDRSLLQVQDDLPEGLRWDAASRAQPQPTTAIAHLKAQAEQRWIYRCQADRRGRYHWNQTHLRTGAPLGLCWGRRDVSQPRSALVYPATVPLGRCPLLDRLGAENAPQSLQPNRSSLATEGVTRTMRPYRWGDATRLIHWRSSARHGELRVRELELFQGGQTVTLCLDRQGWDPEIFEQAVVAAASLYRYGQQAGLLIQLWDGESLLTEPRSVLAHLAIVRANGGGASLPIGIGSVGTLIWLTAQADGLASLPSGSRWLLWADASPIGITREGHCIQAQEPLAPQLQANI
jgi:uncharacterized protein (DUF58 family)